ncbi:hypothetical protein RSOLAG22IIIB_10196 [Rhizoctonia solani]|uniref:HNH nuclease domain-containing protein n=1 Tax=Rhizoctonia solani TaxID=456999 RepID=A0A0K6G284_9AGAM|nr:hypothetical protein RSOLAG22IIIB_10196 [Rhizoctonia solani]
MDTAVPLPPPHGLFPEDEVARTAYARLLPLEGQAELAIRILGQLLIQAPSSEGRTFVANEINNCTTDQEIVELGEARLEQLVQYFKGLRALPRLPDLYLDDIDLYRDETRFEVSVVAPTNYLEAKKQALVRDNYRCMVSGVVDMEAVEILPWLEGELAAKQETIGCTECCYIFPKLEGYPDIEDSGFLHSSSLYTLAPLFGGTDESGLTGTGIHDLRNTLTLDAGICSAFRDLIISLEPTGEAENEYKVVRTYEPYGRDLPKVVRFSSTSPDLPLPDPRLLAFHAACARQRMFPRVSFLGSRREDIRWELSKVPLRLAKAVYY